MQEDEGLQNLVGETLSLLWRQGRSLLFHVLFEVILQVLKHEVQLLLGKQYFFQPKLRTERLIYNDQLYR